MDSDADALTGMLDYEVTASKRYRRFVSLVMMHVRPAESGSQSIMWLDAMREETFRTTDRVFPLDQADTVAIMMGDTAAQGALRAVERFQDRYGEALTVHSSIASYPGDGHTSHDLVSVARRRLDLAERSRPGTAVWRDEAVN